MSNIMKIKYGDTAPQSNDLSSYELGFSNNTGTLYIGIPESGEVVPKEITDLPTGGASGQVLKYDASGTAVWGTDNDTIYSHPATHPASMITGLPTSLPANGGNSDTVDGKHATDFLLRNNTLDAVNRYRDVGHFYGASGTNTGCLIINIGNENYMPLFKISIRSYTYSGVVNVSGYTYSSTADWYAPNCFGNMSSGQFNVRFIANGINGTRYIVIGETTTAWGGYLTVNIDQIIVGYGTATTPMTITLGSGLPAGNISAIQVINGAGSSFNADLLDGKHASDFAPGYSYGTTDLTAGSSSLTTGQLHFVYE